MRKLVRILPILVFLLLFPLSAQAGEISRLYVWSADMAMPADGSMPASAVQWYKRGNARYLFLPSGLDCSALRLHIVGSDYITVDGQRINDLGHGLEYVIADIPGLVEGAAEGAGLGHDFLRHVERTRLLVHVIDMSGIEGRDPLADYNTINQELERFGDLKNRPQIIVSNKMDLPGADVNLQAFRKNCPDVPVYAVSAAAHTGLDALLDAIENKPHPGNILPGHSFRRTRLR